jgi:gamma-glutamylaminecyclotransferase
MIVTNTVVYVAIMHNTVISPPQMYPHDLVIEDGETLTAFLYPRELVEKYNWEDISYYGG